MADDLFPAVDGILASGGPGAGLDYVLDQLKRQKLYTLVFEARLMQKRLELGLPLIQTEATSGFAGSVRDDYEKAMLEAARETGELFLADGQIERAWPYFRAIGEFDAVAEAIERLEPRDDLDGILAIAIQEGVNPAKGLELMLARQGMCRAITMFGMYAIQKDREKCLNLLVRSLHAEVADRIGRAIESVEGTRPPKSTLPELMAGREWLFGEYDYYVDTSHLVSILQYSPEVTDRPTLELLLQLCEYGRHLSQQFRTQGRPPFEDPYDGYEHYVQALLGFDVDAQIAYFRDKLAALDPDEAADGPAQILVNLLVRLERFAEALEISLQYLAGAPSEIPCPPAARLCFLADDFDRMKQIARDRGDILTYIAAHYRGVINPPSLSCSEAAVRGNLVE